MAVAQYKRDPGEAMYHRPSFSRNDGLVGAEAKKPAKQ